MYDHPIRCVTWISICTPQNPVKTAPSLNLSANGNPNDNKLPRQKKTEGKERLGFAAAHKTATESSLMIVLTPSQNFLESLPSCFLWAPRTPAGCLVGLNIKVNKMRLFNLQISEPRSFSSRDFANPLCVLEKLGSLGGLPHSEADDTDVLQGLTAPPAGHYDALQTETMT